MNDDDVRKTPDDRPQPKGIGKDVSVVECTPGRADNPLTGEQVALLTLSFRGEPEMPLILKVADTRLLVAALVEILAQYDDPMGEALQPHVYSADLQTAIAAATPTESAPPRRPRSGHKGGVVRPSRNPKMPPTAMLPEEAWNMTLMMKHSKDHETFMRFISACQEQPPANQPSRRRSQPRRKRRR